MLAAGYLPKLVVAMLRREGLIQDPRPRVNTAMYDKL